MDHPHANAWTSAMSTEIGFETPTRHLARNPGEPDVQVKRSGRDAWESGMDCDDIGEIIATRTLYFFDEGDNKRTVSVFMG